MTSHHYARGWWGFWRLAVAAGVGVATLEWSPVLVLAELTLLCGCAAVGLALLDAGSAAPWRRIAPRAWWIGATLVAELGLAAASPPIALLLALLALATSPMLVRRVVLAVSRRPDRSPDPPLAGLDDGELCRLWRGTFWEMQTQRSLDDLLDMVALRQSCLDELERRDPSALHAWLGSGALDSGGPEKLYREGPHPGSPEAAG